MYAVINYCVTSSLGSGKSRTDLSVRKSYDDTPIRPCTKHSHELCQRHSICSLGVEFFLQIFQAKEILCCSEQPLQNALPFSCIAFPLSPNPPSSPKCKHHNYWLQARLRLRIRCKEHGFCHQFIAMYFYWLNQKNFFWYNATLEYKLVIMKGCPLQRAAEVD